MTQVKTKLDLEDVSLIAPAGYFLALRIGFAFPMEEVNALPPDWVETYTRKGYMLFDPVVRWAYSHTGTQTWAALYADDARGVLAEAASFGLNYGVIVSVFDGNPDGQRSFGSFAREDREFNSLEIKALEAYVQRRHKEMAPPANLTAAELEALRGVKAGQRLKEIAYDLSVTEGAVKQRLKNAKEKLGAKTSTQAAALASQFGLI